MDSTAHNPTSQATTPDSTAYHPLFQAMTLNDGVDKYKLLECFAEHCMVGESYHGWSVCANVRVGIHTPISVVVATREHGMLGAVVNYVGPGETLVQPKWNRDRAGPVGPCVELCMERVCLRVYYGIDVMRTTYAAILACLPDEWRARI